MPKQSGDNSRRSLGLKSGEIVEVRSREEILATLDADGRLNAQPFMPEMLGYCGQRFEVRASAHKTCDTVHGSGARRMDDTVHLADLRCDGSSHGGCQAGCLLFWKEAWLRRATHAVAPRESLAPPPIESALESGVESPVDTEPESGEGSGCTIQQLERAASNLDSEGEIRYSCQATQLVKSSFPVNPMDPRPYLRDLWSRNVSMTELIDRLFFRMISNTIPHVGYRLLIDLYNRVAKMSGGIPYPLIRGKAKGRTPKELLGLKPGDHVRVKSLSEIEETIDARQRNRGLRFDWEMANDCGKEMVVQATVEQIIDESTGRMMKFSNPCIVLTGGICQSRFSDRGRIACPRAIYAYYRENWLEKID